MIRNFNEQANKKLCVHEKGRTHFIEMEDIYYLKCQGYVTTFYLKSKKSISVSKLLREFEMQLNDFKFLRVNRNTIVNLRNVLYIKTGADTILCLVNNEEVKVSSRRLKKIKEHL